MNEVDVPESSWNEKDIREFCGWLSGDLPELNAVEVPRIGESWERFKRMKVRADMPPPVAL
jgi:hypothetical protein